MYGEGREYVPIAMINALAYLLPTTVFLCVCAG